MTANYFHGQGFLADASSDLARLLESIATEVILQPGQILFEEGDTGDALYAVIDGMLELSVSSREGRKLALDVLRKGAVFGEIALFDPGERTATAMAIEPSILRRVKNADLINGIHATPELAVDLIRVAGRRMRRMGSQFSEQVFLPMPTRLARKILYLTDSSGGDLVLSQAELADHVGATREAVSKTLAAWKKEAVVASGRGRLKVLNTHALKIIADFERD
jgi:CRP/FNR family cyclic AMP-dependent transcriptional regulator